MILSPFEWTIAKRYMLPGRGEAVIALVASISIGVVMLSVAMLVIVMSVMNGFRAELIDKITGLNGHAIVQAYGNRLENWEQVLEEVRETPEVVRATPLIEQPLLATFNGRVEAVILRGNTPEDIGRISPNVLMGDINTLQPGANNVAIGSRLAQNLGARVGDVLTVINPQGRSTPFGTVPRQVGYKITTIFGRRVTRQYRGELKTVIEDLDLPNPVIRSHYGSGFIKQYVRDHLNLRTEPATNNVADYGIKKAVENLPQLRQKMAAIIDNYLDVQQDILETFLNRGQLRELAEPTVLSNGKRIPGLKLDHPRQLALMHALVRFAHIAAGSTFTTADLHPHTIQALGVQPTDYSLSSLRYDLSKLRAKTLVEKVPRSRRYRLTRQGYSICLVFLKLFERIYAPLTAGLLHSFTGDSKLRTEKHSQLDRLYQRVADDLDRLLHAVGLNIAA